MVNVLDFKNKFLTVIKNKPKIILIIGLIGIALILFSSVFDKKSEKVSVNNESVEISAEEYGNKLEEKLSVQISEVIGGKVKVMVTLENGIEYIYASEYKNDESEIEDAFSDEQQKLQKDKKSENNYILYKDENGNEVPLVVTRVMPTVKGVVVGCNNGENETISGVVKCLVTTALNITDDKVCVVGLDICK